MGASAGHVLRPKSTIQACCLQQCRTVVNEGLDMDMEPKQRINLLLYIYQRNTVNKQDL